MQVSCTGERGSEEITEGEQDLPRDAKIEFTRSMQARLLCDGVTLAFQSKVNFSFSRPSPREVLLELARNRNKIPLPRSIGGPGIAIPPNQDTLLSQLSTGKSNQSKPWRGLLG
ncbi:Transcription initiation factor TFIID subunit 9, partial [Cucurbita argyrosperma subsp. argyrosperma]